MEFKNLHALVELNPMYDPPPENTFTSLVNGMNMFDAIEFDIRLTKDDQIIIHHDRMVAIDEQRRENRSPFVEDWTLDELTEIGFCSLQTLLEDSSIQKAVNGEGKVLIVESKRPSLKVKRSGGWFEKKKHDVHMGTLMKQAEMLLNEHDFPEQSTIHYAFHASMKDAVKAGGIQRNWSTLLPSIRPFGGKNTHRILAFPEYFTTSFARLMRKHQKNGSPMMPCAMEYLRPPTNRIPIGRTVGLHGKQLQRLTDIRKGFPVYLWPVIPKVEHSVLNAGLSALSDEGNPDMTWLPSGHARWTRPATNPLDAGQQDQLNKATKENHQAVVALLKSEVPSWKECDASRKRELLTYWRKKWKWGKTVDQLLDFEKQHQSMPWEVVRMIGHRGSGKTKRPIF